MEHDGTKFRIDSGVLGQILKSKDEAVEIGLIGVVPWTGTGDLAEHGVVDLAEEYEMCDPMPIVVEINAVSESVFNSNPDDIRLEARLNQPRNGQSKSITCDVFSNCHLHPTAPPVGTYVEPEDAALLDKVDELASSDCVMNTSRGPSIVEVHVATDCKVLPSAPSDEVVGIVPTEQPVPADQPGVQASTVHPIVQPAVEGSKNVEIDEAGCEASHASVGEVAVSTDTEIGIEAEDGSGMREIHVAVEVAPSERDAIEALVSNPPDKPTSVIQYKCSGCEFTVPDLQQARKHINASSHRRAHIKYVCDVCGKDFSSSSNALRHRTSHEEDKPFACPHCYRAFSQKAHVQRHLQQQQSKVTCKHCEFSSMFRCIMNKHKREMHPEMPVVNDNSVSVGSIVWQCGVCEFECTSKKDLAQHMKYHTSRTPLNYKCEHCSFVTDYSCRLKRHALSHTQERPFRCGLCEYRGSQVEHVMRHMRCIHNAEPKHSLESEDEPKITTVLPSRPDVEDLRRTGLLVDIPSPDRVPKEIRVSDSRKMFSCTLCDVGFQRPRNLLKHLEDVHQDDENRYVCSICRTQTTTSSPFLQHLASHKPPSTPVEYMCSYCEFSTEKRRNFIYHMQAKHFKIVHFGSRTSSYGISDMYPDLMTGGEDGSVITFFDPDETKKENAEISLPSAEPMDTSTSDPTNDVLQVTDGDLIQINGIVYRIESSE